MLGLWRLCLDQVGSSDDDDLKLGPDEPTNLVQWGNIHQLIPSNSGPSPQSRRLARTDVSLVSASIARIFGVVAADMDTLNLRRMRLRLAVARRNTSSLDNAVWDAVLPHQLSTIPGTLIMH